MQPPAKGKRRTRGSRHSAPAVLGALLLASPVAARAQSPADDGQWASPFSLPLIAIHSTMLPTGKVLMFSAEHGVPGIHGWILDPQTQALTNVQPPAGWNPDCAGNSFLPDGRLLVAGGTLQFNPLLGSKKAAIFDSFSQNWIPIADMARGRWYPTNITLGDGRVLTMSGINDTNGALNPDIEAWDANSGNTNWSLVGSRTMPDYPYLHLLPDGRVFRAGPDSQTETYNPATNQWTFVDGTNFPARYEAPSVMLPGTPNKIMLIGGYNEPANGTPTSSAEVIDLAAASPTWTNTTPMAFARRDHNAVILPDGKVLVVGGRSSSSNTTPNPVMTPEVFDPATATWDQVAPHQIPRRYHSTAILLPDGRVLAAGGDNQPSGEIYSPSYLFRGPRPAISSSPSIVGYGQTFDLDFASSSAANKVVLIKLSSVTHSNNMDQRYVLLAQNLAAGQGVNISVPSNPNLAPPGYYMLFVVNADGVPSVSSMIQLGLTSSWNVNASGDWSSAGHWSGAVPNSGGFIANFGPAITAARTVTTNVPRTLGAITFDSSNSYTIAGTGTLTIAGGAIGVRSGSHTVSVPLALSRNTTIDVSGGSVLTITQQLAAAAGLALTKAGPGTLSVKNVRAAELSINNGTVAVASNGGAGGTSRVQALTIAAGTKLDLTNNKLIVASGDVGTSDGVNYSGLTGLIQSAHNAGAWSGSGIATSQADALAGLTSLGIATAEQAGYAGGMFGGVSVSSGDVLVMYTYAGDANLDGFISGDDYSAIDFNILIPGSSGWYNGDFNYDGIISGDDYSAIDFNIIAQGVPFSAGAMMKSAAVPEPMSALSLPMIASALLRRRPRRVLRHSCPNGPSNV